MNYVCAKDLYAEIGYDIDVLKKQNSGYANTCPTRVSLALIKSNVHFNGRLKIKIGPYRGNMIETGAKLLADQLTQSNAFGKPQIFKDPKKASEQVGSKKGVVFFWKITGYDGGHIDLIESHNNRQLCNSECYFNCKEVWFWELN